MPFPEHLRGGRFTLVSLLGEGGMGSVYRAYDHELEVWRAVKLLAPKFASNKQARQRFTTEARTMAALEHAHVVRVYDVGVEGKFPYIVMELAEGGCPANWLQTHGPMPSQMAVTIAIQVCRGLHEAHGRGIIHRDVKPHNVLVDGDGQCKVTDFGIARVVQENMQGMTMTGSVMGTMGFMAPEQRSNTKAADHRADIYAVGATLFTLLTATVTTELHNAALDPEILAGIPEPLLDPIRQATAYKPVNRYESILAFGRALTLAQIDLPTDPGETPSLIVPLKSAPIPQRAAPVRDHTFEATPPSAPVPDTGTVNPTLRGWKNLPGGKALAYSTTDHGPQSASEPPKQPAPKPEAVPTEVRKPTLPLVAVDVEAGEAAWLVIHKVCEPKRLHGGGRPMHGIMAIEHHLGIRSFGRAMALAAEQRGLHPDRVKTRMDTERGSGWVTADSIAEMTGALDVHDDECSTCTARMHGGSYGCFLRLPYPIPERAEAWLMERLQVSGQIGGDLCLDMVSSNGLNGRPIAALRAKGGFEAATPVTKILKRGWMMNSKVSSDQVFHALMMADLNFLVPFNCLAVAAWFGVVEVDGVAPDEVTEAGLAQVAKLSTFEERMQRTRVRLGSRTSDPAIQNMQHILLSLYLAWAHDVKLLAEP